MFCQPYDGRKVLFLVFCLSQCCPTPFTSVSETAVQVHCEDKPSIALCLQKKSHLNN
uniref:Uncharacterized protein n=1 Tax=Anguilla anguilla TaxID=7936 RepID=A0A0E9QDP5_ANGAN